MGSRLTCCCLISLPAEQGPQKTMTNQSAQTISIPGLVSTCDQLHRCLLPDNSVQIPPPDSALPDSAFFQVCRNRITTKVAEVEKIFAATSTTAANLPIRSRRAYQWLKYLSRQEQLIQHVQTLIRAEIQAQEGKRARKFRGLQLQVRLYHQGALYTIRKRKEHLLLSAHQGFSGAPDHVLQALLTLAQQGRSHSARKTVQDYAAGKHFSRIREHLEYLGVPRGSYAAGTHRDLVQLFQQVNRKYFQGQIPPPRLTWSSRLTFRKFGHYQYDTDTIMLSASLDQPSVPAYVLEYVMYHELLHKILGYHEKKGRRYAHTAAFTKKEAEFPRLEQAQHYLRKLSAELDPNR